MSRDLLDLVRELNTLNDDNLADRVIENNDVQWCLSELQDILEEMPTLTPQNEWVNVENALPPNMDDVLVVVQNNGERWTVTGYYSNTSNVWYAMLNGQDTQMDVLWWMPLPAPPDRRPPEGEA